MSEPPVLPVADVEALLADLAGQLAWPVLPDAVDAARNRLVAGERCPAPRARWRPFAIAASVVVFALAVALIVPGTRSALADLFGLGGVTVRQVPTTAAPSTPPISGGLDLGQATTLDDARDLAPFAVLAPTDLGPPDAVFTAVIDERLVLSLTYAPRPGLPAAAETDLGLLVTEFAGTIDRFIEKQVGAGQAERLTIDGHPAIWVEGPHQLLFEDSRGEVSTSDSRLAANTLVVSRSGTTIRLEGGFDQATAIALARSLQ